MYGIEKVVYLLLTVDRKRFNQILNGKILEVRIKYNSGATQRVHRNNEFIRIKKDNSEDYMDIAIREIILKRSYIIKLGKLIDTNKDKRI